MTDIKERPIIFNGAMVRAILAGEKTQTRRVVKPQPGGMDSYYGKDFRKDFSGRKCPYGKPGDRLWVRETWGVGHNYDAIPPNLLRGLEANTHYRAMNIEIAEVVDPIKWRPSIHMPRELSRILLEVTAVRVERLQDISEKDAKAEGLCKTSSFRTLWDSINAKKYPWDSNPWVWAITFKVVS